MGANHRNRSWRAQWTLDQESRTAVHKSGVVARVSVSPNDPRNDRITLEHTDRINHARWDLGRLAEQAVKLWMEGKF